MTATLIAYGDRAVCLRVDAPVGAHVTRAFTLLRNRALRDPRVEESYFAYRELVVVWRAPVDLRHAEAELLAHWRAGREVGDAAHAGGRLHRIPVRYDGEDLRHVAERTGLSVGEVVEIHAGRRYDVYALGFQLGFGFLGDLPEVLELPRRTEPRARVPPGSVAVAGRQTAIYPNASPGGWHLIGHTDYPLVGEGYVPVLRVGDAVEFVPVAG